MGWVGWGLRQEVFGGAPGAGGWGGAEARDDASLPRPARGRTCPAGVARMGRAGLLGTVHQRGWAVGARWVTRGNMGGVGAARDRARVWRVTLTLGAFEGGRAPADTSRQNYA